MLRILSVLFLLFSCKEVKVEEKKEIIDSLRIIQSVYEDDSSCNNNEVDIVTKRYTDSLQFGEKGKYKITSMKIDKESGSIIKINFYNRKKGNWKIIDSFEREITSVLIPDIQFVDYNFDGYNDLSYNSDIGMNGSNEMRTIFLFTPKTLGIKCLDDATNYPNIRLNKKKKFLVSTIFSGSTQNVFFRIENDTFREIARIETDDKHKLKLTKFDKTGKEIYNKTELMKNVDRYTWFMDFNPIKIK